MELRPGSQVGWTRPRHADLSRGTGLVSAVVVSAAGVVSAVVDPFRGRGTPNPRPRVREKPPRRRKPGKPLPTTSSGVSGGKRGGVGGTERDRTGLYTRPLIHNPDRTRNGRTPPFSSSLRFRNGSSRTFFRLLPHMDPGAEEPSVGPKR